MYKTVGECKNTGDNFIQYHFGKHPTIPPLEVLNIDFDELIETEILFDVKLNFSFRTFFRCLFKKYKIERKHKNNE
jgi:hypothetical protein